MKKWGQLINSGFLGDARDGGDDDSDIYRFTRHARHRRHLFEKVGAVSINEFPVFQKIPLYNNEVGEKKYSWFLKIPEKILDSRHVFEFCAHCFKAF